jgi:hypothetical protein
LDIVYVLIWGWYKVIPTGVIVVAPACVTVIVLVIPSPETVTVPVLADAAVLAVADIVKFPLFDPLAGDTVSHVWLVVTDHEVFEVTETVVLAADAVGFHDVVFTVSVGVAA